MNKRTMLDVLAVLGLIPEGYALLNEAVVSVKYDRDELVLINFDIMRLERAKKLDGYCWILCSPTEMVEVFGL